MIEIQPLSDFILVERQDLAVKGQSLILIPDAAKDKPQYGVVIAAGPGRVLDSGALHPTTVQKDDKIVFGKYAGIEIELGDKKVIVMKESEILGIVKIGAASPVKEVA